MRLRLDARGRRLLARLPMVNVYSLAELALLALLAVQAARFVWVVVTPIGPLGDWRPAAPVVAGSPAEMLAAFDPFFRLSGGDAAGPAAVTPLQLTLFGTRIDEATGRGSAIVAGADGMQQSVSVGDEVQPGVRLKAVAFDHVTLDRGGRAEDLFLDQSKSVQPVQPGGDAAAPGGVTLGQLRAEIGFTPRVDNGRLTGLVVRPQGTGAAFRAAGLREGDVVVQINGRPVTGAQDLDRVAADFAKGGTLPLTAERGRDTVPLSVQIAPGP